jgi:photosystem II stability/assembly factor-like uncharacterized protein
MDSVVRAGPGFVAVGVDRDREAGAVWTSPDGREWSRVPHDEVFTRRGDATGMHSVAAIDSRVVAVGPGPLQAPPESSIAMVWTSPDGREWSRVPHDQAIFGDGPYKMHSVAANDSTLVAIGVEDSEDVEGVEQVIWRSSDDGDTWSLVTSEQPRPFVLHDVIAAGSGFVGVGVAEEGASVWTSSDGRTWSRDAPLQRASDNAGSPEASVLDGSRLITVGFEGAFSKADAAVWVGGVPDLP